MAVAGDLKAAAFDVWHAVILILKIDPRGHLRHFESRVTCRDAEEKNFLARRENASAQNAGKYFWQPRPTGEDKSAGGERLTARGFQRRGAILASARLGGERGFLPIVHAVFLSSRNHGLHSAARHQNAALRLENSPGVILERNLRAASAQITE